MKLRTWALWSVTSALTLCTAAVGWAAEAKESQFKGWKSLSLDNGIIQVEVVPVIGGRVMRLRLGDHDYLWVNPQLAGKEPTATGTDDKGGWLNYGGDKLWPAPQGWDNDQQWPGPPGGSLDGTPHKGRITAAQGFGVAVQLEGPPDKAAGVAFSREIQLSDNAARVSFDSVMKNTDTKPRRWGIWQVTQINAAGPDGQGYNKDIRCYSLRNAQSVFPKGYLEMFGLINNPSFSVDKDHNLVVAHYQRRVGKIGIDNNAGWVATVDGTAGYVFVERFKVEPNKPVPDNTTAQFWMNGPGEFVCGKNLVTAADDYKETPALVETEVIGPYVDLKPGEAATSHVDWYAAKIGGNYPVLACSDGGVVCEPVTATLKNGKVQLAGRYGVFYTGELSAACYNAAGKQVFEVSLGKVSPLEPVILAKEIAAPEEAVSVTFLLSAHFGLDKMSMELAHAPIVR